jgi:hypothetical protein
LLHQSVGERLRVLNLAVSTHDNSPLPRQAVVTSQVRGVTVRISVLASGLSR